MLAANQSIFKNLEYAHIHKTAKISPSAHISGVALIEENVVIDHNAVIIGPCFIGRNSYIGTNSLIRGYSCIERDCLIGYSVEVKNSIVQPETKIGRLSFVGDTIIGENATLGSGVTTMNILEDDDKKRISKLIKGRIYHKLGAVIGPNSTIGSNTVLSAGVVVTSEETIPSGSVVK
jgi:NDP-sugar pyrophosphorylase family protein